MKGFLSTPRALKDRARAPFNSLLEVSSRSICPTSRARLELPPDNSDKTDILITRPSCARVGTPRLCRMVILRP